MFSNPFFLLKEKILKIKMTISAIIPIKYNSSRIPGKNFKIMNDKPLFYYIINTLLECNIIENIILNIDDDSIKTKILEHFSSNKIIFHMRPDNLRGDDVSTNNLIKDTLLNTEVKSDIFLQTHVTNPLLSQKTILKAIDTFNTPQNGNDSLFTVKTLYTRLYDKNSKAINHDPNNLIPTQDLDPLYEENSCLYIFKKEKFLETGKRIGKKPFLFKMNDLESQDIDWPEDFILTEQLMRQNNYKDKVILITGINGGIGNCLGKFFMNKKWTVIGLDIKESKELNCNIFYQCDLSNEEQIKNIVKQLNCKINVIVNNAAFQICKKLVDSTYEEWNKVMNINLRSVFLLSKYLYPKLQDNSNINLTSSIINISSVHATHTSKDIGIYATSKGGLTTLTRSMAIEFAEHGIRVNAILPGAINTEMLRSHFPDPKDLETLKKKHVIGRIGEPSDISEMVYFLSDNKKSGFITGQSFYVDGGATIKLSSE